MPRKPGEFEVFEPAKGLKYMRAQCCDGRVNHWNEVVELDEPKVFGSATPNPTVFALGLFEVNRGG